MALAENTGGTHAGTGAFVTLATITAAGYYALNLDLTNMDLGDEVHIRISTKVRSASGSVVAYQKSYKHTVSQPVQISPFIASPFEVKFEIKATSGDDYVWSVYEA